MRTAQEKKKNNHIHLELDYTLDGLLLLFSDCVVVAEKSPSLGKWNLFLESVIYGPKAIYMVLFGTINFT